MMTYRNLLWPAALAGAAIALSACGGGGQQAVVTPPPPPPPPQTFADMFGSGFGADFAAAANTTPSALSGKEIIAVSLTASPVPFPDGTPGTN